MSAEKFYELDVNNEIRNFISDVAGVRAKAMQILEHLKKENAYEMASNELEEAIENLYQVETNLGNAHQHILVSNAMQLADIEY